MRDQYMRTGQGFMIVYSVTSPSSFHEVSQFRDQILRVKDADNVPIVIVGNNVRVPCCCALCAACVADRCLFFRIAMCCGGICLRLALFDAFPSVRTR